MSNTESTDPTLESRGGGGGKKRLWLAAGVVVTIVAVIGGIALATTGDGTASASGTGSAPSANPNASVTVGLVLEPTNLDIRATAGAALDQVLIDNVYEGLLTRTAAGKLVPSLASAWKVSSDALTYTFTLKDGVTFSNGDPLTSQNVVWSIKNLIDKKLVESASLGSVKDVSAPNKATVQIRLASPYPDLLWALSGRAGLVLDAAATNDLKTSAIGSGPYLLDTWKQGDSITLKRNNGYWGKDKAKVAEVVVRYITDPNAAVNAVLSGDLDVLAPVTATLRPQVDKLKGVRVVEGDAPDKFVLAFNNAKAPFTDIRVRQAVRYAIDHKALVTARGGVDQVLGGPITSSDPGYEDLSALYPHDPTKAKTLLADAGFSGGLALKLTIPSFYGAEIPDLLTSQLAEVGIILTVKRVEFSTWLSDVFTKKNYDLSIVDHAENHDFGAWANPDYYFGYANKDVHNLYAQSQTASTADGSDALLRKAARIVSQDAAADWLFNYRTLTVVSNRVHGFPTDAVNSRLDLTGLSAAS